MFFFLISCFSFIFFFRSCSFKPLRPIKTEWKLLLSPWFWEDLSSFLLSWFHKGRLAIGFCQAPMKMPLKKMNMGSKDLQEYVEENKISLLDLPDLALECILEKLSPALLCTMTGVCRSLRDSCTSDHLWKKPLKKKWGQVIGDAAYREWQWHIAFRNRSALLDQSNQKGLLVSLGNLFSFSWIKAKFGSSSRPRASLPLDSVMSLYLSLESGTFWFPAQVYNRENGHVGFMLSCYDAKLCYDPRTDTFQARYSPHGRRTVEECIHWDRLRAPPVDTPPHDLHISDCIQDLKPGDHVEIQWRRSNDFPYGWWYAEVGHLESCDGSENSCHCSDKDTVVLEFNQYTPGSRWRRTIINRKDHREEGNEADGFYGGVRKLYKEEEISMWKQLWPKQVLD